MRNCEKCFCDIEPINNKSIMDIIVDVCDFYEIYYTEIISKKRNRHLVEIRAKIFDLLYSDKSNNYTLTRIGGYFGKRDHTTIIHSIANVKKLCSAYPEYRDEYKKLHLKIYGSLKFFRY